MLFNSYFIEYTGDSDSDGYVLDENENFDEATNIEVEGDERNDNDSELQDEENRKESTESRKRQHDEGTNYSFYFHFRCFIEEKAKVC